MTDAPKVVPIEQKDVAVPADKAVEAVAPTTAAPAATPDVAKP
jgi:hypothetical protein